jgi:hypothetical protein
LEEVATDAKPCRIAENTIPAQWDDVVTKSQEPGKKMNKTYTSTLATSEGECFYLAAKSSQELIRQVMAHVLMPGLFFGKRLEVISDGARWIGEWVGSMTGREPCALQSREQCAPQFVEIEHVLCWYPLCKRIDEGLSAVGLTKDRRKALEREVLGHLWRGETALTVWRLWGLQSPARIPQRIENLTGDLLRKKRMIVNYAARREQGLWLARNRVEKWNDAAISER